MKKLTALLLTLSLSTAVVTGSVSYSLTAKATGRQNPAAAVPAVQTPANTTAKAAVKAPKYVFLFIGDGMSCPQFQAASDYLGTMTDPDYMLAVPSLEDNQGAVLDGPVALNIMNFETAGSVVTYDSNSIAPDSVSTATSISTGHKTYSGSINVDETATISYETVTENDGDDDDHTAFCLFRRLHCIAYGVHGTGYAD